MWKLLLCVKLVRSLTSLAQDMLHAMESGQRIAVLLQVEIFCYALSPSDNSEWRQRIEREAEHFLDVSSWSVPDIAGKISADAIHVAVNLNGYTKVSCAALCQLV